MRYLLFSFITVLLAGAIVALTFLPPEYGWILYLLIGLALLLLLLLFRSVLMPAQAVRHGLDLISAQDFNNRLVKVGEPEADRLVTLFNTMIDKLRNERLLNRERESFLQLLVEASPMGVVMLDFDGRVTLVNPSFLKITGIVDDNDVMGLRMDDLRSELAHRMATVPLGECEVIRRGDIRRYRCYHLSFIQSGFKREFYLLESLTEEVMKAERNAYEKVIRIISHEVNNTMGGVRSVLDTLHDLSDSDDVREVIESCDNRCDQMTRFISSYADVVRVPEPVKAPVNLNAMLADMLPFLQGMTPAHITLRFIPSSSPVVSLGAPGAPAASLGAPAAPVSPAASLGALGVSLGAPGAPAGGTASLTADRAGSTASLTADIDLSLMQQVIVNIVKNAIESIPTSGFSSSETGSGTSGHIEISTGMRDGRPMIDISNDGEPISDEVSAQLFSPFFTTKREGRGIGLTLISEILNRHGAAYSLKTTPDSLTRFTILL